MWAPIETPGDAGTVAGLMDAWPVRVANRLIVPAGYDAVTIVRRHQAHLRHSDQRCDSAADAAYPVSNLHNPALLEGYLFPTSFLLVLYVFAVVAFLGSANKGLTSSCYRRPSLAQVRCSRLRLC